MTKKKTIVNLDAEPLRDAPMTGDLVISYDGIDRYATSETQQIELETERTICWHHIDIDYVKPVPTPNYTVFSFEDKTGEGFELQFTKGVMVDILNDGKLTTISTLGNGIIPKLRLALGGNKYEIAFAITADSDILDITVNGSPLTYDNGAYSWEYSEKTYPESVTAVFDLKAAGK